MQWSETAKSVWGKTDPRAEPEETAWLPLVQHLEDSADVAGYLWDNWLPPNVRRVISDQLPAGEEDGRRLSVFLAGAHDVGKASPAFAIKARRAAGDFGYLTDRMVEQGLTMPPLTGDRLAPHCRVGHLVVREWLVENGMPRHAAQGFASPVGAHHGTPPTATELRMLASDPMLGLSPAWDNVRAEILNEMAVRADVRDRLPAWRDVCLPLPAQVLLSSAVVVADWLASDSARFPYDVVPGQDRLELADLAIDLLPSRWDALAPGLDPDVLLSQRFPHLVGKQPHPVQRDAVTAAAEQDQPSLMIIEAPMGQGKTEAALAAAEVLAARFGLGGVLVGLPTMATSDAMFARVHSWVDQIPAKGPRSIFLAHGKAALNEEYEDLVRAARFAGIGEPEDDAGWAQASMWLQGRRKGILSSMVVGTIDQALMGALKVRHVALRHLGLASKVVVLDEVHAADVYMSQFLESILEWLSAYGVPVVLLSATLPPARREQLLAAYARGRHVEHASMDAGLAYPRITIQSDARRTVEVESTGPGRDLEVGPLADDPSALTELVVPAVGDGACVIVIRNTVTRAQETYGLLADALGGERVMLLHSRFVGVQRMDREKRLRDLLGPPRPGVDRPDGYVVVGTQVLEQSLDIDADLMVADLAPIDLLLQRAGRLHRHARGTNEVDRPAALRRPRLYVTGFRAAGLLPPTLERGASAIYGAASLLRSLAVLQPHLAGEPVRLPADIPRLVRDAYDPSLAPPQGWEQAWAAAAEDEDRTNADRVSKARAFRLGDPFYDDSLLGWTGAGVDDVDDEFGAPAVRDGEDGLEVLVVQRDAEGVRVLAGTGEHAGQLLPDVSIEPPPGPVARALAGHTLKLPASLTRWRTETFVQALEDVGRDFMGWQTSPWLRGLLVLPLNAEGEIELVEQKLSYDSLRGLRVLRTEGAGHE